MVTKAENYRERHSRVQINLRRKIMKFMKKRKIRRIASLFMAVLMVAALMPGSITNTKADDKTADSGVVVDAGTWENNERTIFQNTQEKNHLLWQKVMRLAE